MEDPILFYSMVGSLICIQLCGNMAATTKSSHQLVSQEHEQKCIRTMQELVVCSQCSRYIKNKPFIFGNCSMCIGCFCKAVPKNAVYSLINCSQRLDAESRFTLQDYLQVLCSAEKFGIDNLYAIEQQFKHRYNRHDIEEMMRNLMQWSNNNKQNGQSYKKKFNTQAIYNNKSVQLQKNQVQENSLVWKNKQVQENIIDYNIPKQKDYQLTDYILSSLHQNTPIATRELFIAYKLREDQLTHQITTIIQQISSQHNRKTNATSNTMSRIRYAQYKEIKRKKREMEKRVLERGIHQIDILHQYQSLLAQNQRITTNRRKQNRTTAIHKTGKKIKRAIPHHDQYKSNNPPRL